MNTETGEIHRFASQAALHAFQERLRQRERTMEAFKDAVPEIQPPMPSAESFVELRGEPDANCRKCYGRGHVGRNTLTNLFVPCSCCS